MDWLKYPNRGPDPRILGKVGALLQNLFSLPFMWLHGWVPVQLLVCFFPPFLSFAFQWSRAPYFCTLRAGWRYDVNYKGGSYIADVIIKPKSTTLVHY